MTAFATMAPNEKDEQVSSHDNDNDNDEDNDENDDDENDDDVEDQEEMDSADEALCEMLGLNSLNTVVVGETKDAEELENSTRSIASSLHMLPVVSDTLLLSLVQSHQLTARYSDESVCIFPPELCISAARMRLLTEELVWGGDDIQADRTYEIIKVWKQGEIIERQTLTRLENFVDAHDGWSELCHGYLRRCLSAVVGMDMVLYKEKLNVKPPGGSGFAPHLDSPSLRVALGPKGPQTFCTIMVAIDEMTSENGCLRVCKGPWSEDNCCEVTQPEQGSSPDAGGRAGAVPIEVAERLAFEDLTCKGGTIVAFNGWTPHRSSANQTQHFPRRAVFLTYNPKSEGEFRSLYYEKMDQLRTEWREKVGLANRQRREEEKEFEIEALATVPRL
jgi:hypothetical protein